MRGVGILLLGLGVGGGITSIIGSFGVNHQSPSLFSMWAIPLWGTLIVGGALALLFRRPQEPSEMEDLISISTLENDVEASVLDEALEEEGIPHIMKSYYDSAYDGLFQFQHGWGVVMGPESQSHKILEILTDLRNESPSVT